MKIYRSLGYALVFAACLLITAGTGHAQIQEGKIPITTSSKEALDYFLQGRDLGEKLRFLESREYYEKAVAADTNFALAYLNLSFTVPTVRGFFQNFGKALSLADQASEGERLMILAIDAGTKAEALKQIKIYRQLAAAYPNDERAHTLLGNSLFGQQDYSGAIEQYKKALAINPEFSQPYNQLGYSHRFLGNYAEAEKAFQKYIKLIPDDPNPYDSYAELLMKMGKFEESIKHYRKALEVTPAFNNSYAGIACNYNFLGEHKKARELLQKYYGMAADNGQRRAVHTAKSISFADEGNLDKALSELKKQFTLAQKADDAPAMAGDCILLGNILMEAGRYDEALTYYKKSVKFMQGAIVSQDVKDNAKRGFLFNSGRVMLMQGNLEQAKSKAKEFHKSAEAVGNPLQIRLAHQLAGMIALEEEKWTEAIAEFEQANLQNPYNWYRLAMAYKGAGDTEKAKEACERAATHNTFNSFNYAFIRHKAAEELSSM